MNLDLDYLTQKLRNPEAILKAIDNDPMLAKRQNPQGLVIANATAGLFTPLEEHQLYAKGIVYRRDPYRLVSLPLIKMYNHGEKDFVQDITLKCLEEGLPMVMPFKEDGFLAQFFEWEDKVYCTTRSILEGVDLGIDFDPVYIDMIYENADGTPLLDPKVVAGKTIICEAIHPNCHSGVTKYGVRKDLVVIAIFDHVSLEYWSTHRVNDWALSHNLSFPETLATRWEDVEDTIQKLSTRSDIPEGGVVCFEKEGRIVHRVKMKTQEWFRITMMMRNCTLRETFGHLWSNPELKDWETYLGFLRERDLVVEEIEDRYHEFFDSYVTWVFDALDRVRDAYAQIQEIEKGREAKEVAFFCKENHADDFALFMGCYRRNPKVLHTALKDKRYEPFNGALDYLQGNFGIGLTFTEF